MAQREPADARRRLSALLARAPVLWIAAALGLLVLVAVLLGQGGAAVILLAGLALFGAMLWSARQASGHHD